ncbi:MAG: hypothetical protein ABIL09_11795 [Gemmatimonadota bacterium]
MKIASLADVKAVAELLAPSDGDDLESLLLSRSPGFQAMLRRSRLSLEAGKGLSEDAFWKAVDKGRGKSKRRKKVDGAED